MIRQLDTQIQIKAINICPIAHPMARTIGVDALEV